MGAAAEPVHAQARQPQKPLGVQPVDCQRIIEKTAELKLKEDNVREEDIPKQIAGYKEARGDEAMKKCVGRTITKEALTCVEMAQTSDALDKCLY